MRFAGRSVDIARIERIVTLTVITLAGTSPAVATAQEADERRLSGSQNLELRELSALVDRIEVSDLPGGDAWLKWNGHFLRGPDDKTYVPFTLTIDEAPGAFERVGLYIRVTEDVAETEDDTVRGDTLDRVISRGQLIGTDPGSLPVNTPEAEIASRRDGDEGAVMPSESAAIARALHADLLRQQLLPPFEDVHFLAPEIIDDQGARVVRRALAVEPGTYTLYVAVREFPWDETGGAPRPRWAVVKRRLTVPDLGDGPLTTSSILLAERIVPASGALSPMEQAQRPYALGAAEIVPVPDQRFHTDETLSLVFFAYNLAAVDGKPDAAVRYRFFRSGIAEALVVATAPQRFDATTLPAEFDLDASGGQLPIDASIPLATFVPGLYRLEIELTDRVAGVSVRRDVRFTVTDPP